jgi:hypothetical protein
VLDGAVAAVDLAPPDDGMTTDGEPAPDGAVVRGGGVTPDRDPEPLAGGPDGREPDWLAGWFPGRARRDRLLTFDLPHVRSMGRRRHAGRR